jgi:hypothetical protein
MGNVLSANYRAIYPLLKRLEQRDYIKTGAIDPVRASPTGGFTASLPPGRNTGIKS